MGLQRLKQQVSAQIDALAPELVRISHAIHAKPELAFEEFFAHETLTQAVEDHGLDVTRQACGLDTAFVSAFGSGTTEIGIISEYDALPAIGHACGHNIIAAAGLGAALGLAKLGADLPGKVRYLGTPGEEGGGGKEYMAQENAFDGLDAAMMVHPAGADLITMPSLAMTEVKVTYHGRNAHAAVMPHDGINALDALVTAYQSLAQLRQHIRPTEKIHGIFTEAGDAPNIVPHRASGVFYVRAADGVALGDIKSRVQNCLEAGALASGCRAEIVWAKVDYLEIKDNWDIAQAYRDNAEKLGRTFFPLDNLSASGSTDMGNVSHRVPSIHPMIACAPPEINIHHPDFTRHAASAAGDQAVLDGAKAMAMTALDVMLDEELREKSKAAFRQTETSSRKAVSGAWHADGNPELGGCGCC
ncbi:MAG: M20 family metallopeptidase [Parvibaculales bacterium]